MSKEANIAAGVGPIVRHRQAGGFLMLGMGLIFAIVGGCVSWFLGSDTILTCQRSRDTCILEKISMFGRTEVVANVPLSRVKSAEVEGQKGSRTKSGSRRRASYQVVLRTDHGTIPFSNVWTWEQKAHMTTPSSINSYLASSEESLSIVQSGKVVRLIGYLFIAAGGLAFFRGLRGVINMFRALTCALSARS